MEKTEKFSYDYAAIRHGNLIKIMREKHGQRIEKAAKFHAHFIRGINKATVNRKSFKPNSDDICFAESVYGNWYSDWANKPFSEILELLRIYDGRWEVSYKYDYDITVEKEINALTEAWNVNDNFSFDDTLNYERRTLGDHLIFVDLYFRDENGNRTIFFNTMYNRVEVVRENGERVPFSDAMLRGVFRNYFPFKTQDRVINEIIRHFIQSERGEYAYNPVYDYIKGLEGKWDGKERLETVFIDYLKADDNKPTRDMTRNWLINAVRCVLFPEKCKNKFPYMLVLLGDTNIGKTCIMDKLFTLNGHFYTTYGIDMKKTAAKNVPLMKATWGIDYSCWLGKDTVFRSIIAWMNDFTVYHKKYDKMFSYYYPHNCVYATSNDTSILDDWMLCWDNQYWIIQCHGTESEFVKNETWKAIQENVEQI